MISLITATNRSISDRTWKSVMTQTDKNFEWIIVEDGAVAGSIDSPVLTKYISLNKNYGPSVARNIGFEVSDGDVIAYLDSDDELSVDRIRHLNYIYSEFPNVELLFDPYYVEQRGKSQLFSLWDYAQRDTDGDFEKILKMLDQQNISIPLGVSHRRKIFVDAGKFQRGIVCGEDGILWRRMRDILDLHNIMFTDSIAGTYHVNESGQSRTQRRFDMGGFAFNGAVDGGTNGQYLDVPWFSKCSSVEFFDKKE